MLLQKITQNAVEYIIYDDRRCLLIYINNLAHREEKKENLIVDDSYSNRHIHHLGGGCAMDRAHTRVWKTT